MKEEIQNLYQIISNASLPREFDDLFSEVYDRKHNQFILQENVLLDYKETYPQGGDLDYRSGLLKLIISFHNVYGGIIVFGVRDVDFRPVGVVGEFDVEKYNALLSQVFGEKIELVKRSYTLTVSGEVTKIVVLLVPRRISVTPSVSKQSYGQIVAGAIYVRERHEAKIASSRHFPLLFSNRDEFYSDLSQDIVGLQYSAPPSPSTLPKFIGRDKLSFALWEWLLNDKKPRIYLSGAGGSGKSTLAYEFMDQVAKNWSGLKLRNGEKIDFVTFVSAKETELNVRTGVEQKYSLRQFADVESLLRLILTSVGGEETVDVEELCRNSLIDKLELLFDNFNGLIVIDDIDALSRAGLDTGEEDLMLLASQARKVVKIIYTLRNDASYARNAALPVPGLDEKIEIPEFIDACCTLFNTEKPNQSQIQELAIESSCLPLLIETIVGLRTNSSSYDQAIRDFRDRGGEAARSYLYQREYEKLQVNGKGRQVLATLMEYGRPLGFDAICALTNSGDSESIRIAINETANIFLKVSTAGDGTTVYGLSPSAAGFVRTYSKRLPYYRAIQRAVEHYRRDTAHSTPKEAATIARAERLLKSRQFDAVVTLSGELDESDTVWVNPKFMSILGRALVQANSSDLVKARELFRAAANFGFDDILMFRAWYHAERMSGYRFDEAIEVCQRVLGNSKYSDRYRSEFSSKIGECLSMQARQISGVDSPDKARLFADAVMYYSWAMHFAASTNDLDRSKTLDWFSRALHGYISGAAGDFSILLRSLEEPIKNGMSFNHETSQIIERLVSGAARSRDVRALRKSQGSLNGGIGSLTKAAGKRFKSNIAPLVNALENGKKSFELRIMQLSGQSDVT